MPTYDYECQSCGIRFEKFQMMSDRVLRKCRECGESKLVRLIGSGGGLIFKGSGFYETDYRTQSYKDAAKADQDAASGSAGDAKSDTTKSKPSDGGGAATSSTGTSSTGTSGKKAAAKTDGKGSKS